MNHTLRVGMPRNHDSPEPEVIELEHVDPPSNPAPPPRAPGIGSSSPSSSSHGTPVRQRTRPPNEPDSESSAGGTDLEAQVERLKEPLPAWERATQKIQEMFDSGYKGKLCYHVVVKWIFERPTKENIFTYAAESTVIVGSATCYLVIKVVYDWGDKCTLALKLLLIVPSSTIFGLCLARVSLLYCLAEPAEGTAAKVTARTWVSRIFELVSLICVFILIVAIYILSKTKAAGEPVPGSASNN